MKALVMAQIKKVEKPRPTPSKFMNPLGFKGMDTQKELNDFQNKQQPTKVQARDDDLSKVLDDALQNPTEPDQGLYSGKKK